MGSVAHRRYGIRNSLPPDHQSPKPEQKKGWIESLQLPSHVIGRFVLDKHSDADGHVKRRHDKYGSNPAELVFPHPLVQFSRDLRSQNPNIEDRGAKIVHPKQLILRYLTDEMIRQRYNIYAARRGYTNKTNRHHTNNLRDVKRDVAAALREELARDACDQNLLLEQKVIDRQEALDEIVQARQQRKIDKLGGQYDEDFELVASAFEDTGPYHQDGPIDMKLRKRIIVDDDYLSLGLSMENLQNRRIVLHDLARINQALRQTGLISKEDGYIKLDDVALDVPVVNLAMCGYESVSKLVTPLTPAGPVQFQPLGMHEVE